MNYIGSFSGISVDNLAAAKAFYQDTMGLVIEDEEIGLKFALPGGGALFVYEKADHQPASFTVINLVVDNINNAIDTLTNEHGVIFERYNNLPAPQDERGVLRGKAAGQGPDIAWLQDPAGNVLALIEN